MRSISHIIIKHQFNYTETKKLKEQLLEQKITIKMKHRETALVSYFAFTGINEIFENVSECVDIGINTYY